jgi:hypothetical protein
VRRFTNTLSNCVAIAKEAGVTAVIQEVIKMSDIDYCNENKLGHLLERIISKH